MLALWVPGSHACSTRAQPPSAAFGTQTASGTNALSIGASGMRATRPVRVAPHLEPAVGRFRRDP